MSLAADRGPLLWQYTSSTFQSSTPNVSIISPFVGLAQPEASGHMELASADYCDVPLIYFNCYGSPDMRISTQNDEGIVIDMITLNPLYGLRRRRGILYGYKCKK